MAVASAAVRPEPTIRRFAINTDPAARVPEMPVVGRLRYLEALPRDACRRWAPVPRGGAGQLTARSSSSTRFPLNARMWEPQLALADHGWRVIVAAAARLRRRRRPTPPATTVDDYAGDVIDLLDALHIDEAVIGGLSMGGYVTFAVFRHAAAVLPRHDSRRHAAQADTPEGVEGRQRMIAAACASKGAAAVADEMMPKLLGASPRATRPESSNTRPRPDPVELDRGDRRRHHGADDAPRFDAAAADDPLPDARSSSATRTS